MNNGYKLIEHQNEVLAKIRSYGYLISHRDLMQFINEPGLVYDYNSGCLRCFMLITVGCSAIDSSGQRVVLRDAPHSFMFTDHFYFESCESWESVSEAYDLKK